MLSGCPACSLVITLATVLVGCTGSSSKAAIKHLQCDVCHFAAEEVWRYASQHHIHEEDDLADLIDGLCSVRKEEGKWITRLDIVHNADSGTLAIKPQEEEGVCGDECKILQRACAASLRSAELTLTTLTSADNEGVESFQRLVCLTSCELKKAQRIDTWVDEVFKPVAGRKNKNTQPMPELVARNMRCGSSDMSIGWIGPSSLVECQSTVLSISDCFHSYFFHASTTDRNCGCVQRSEGLTDKCDGADQHPQTGVDLYRISAATEGKNAKVPKSSKKARHKPTESVKVTHKSGGDGINDDL